MKKIITGIITAAALLLLVSCEPKANIGPAEPTGSAASATPVVEPTCTPQADVTPQITIVPEPTEEPLPTETPTVAPTKEPEPTEEPLPTETPTAVPTKEPEPTAAPTELPEPTATPSPTPYINPETLVNHGWQKNISIDEKYTVIFPDLFRDSTVVKENKTLIMTFTCPEDVSVEFRISYLMQRTLQEAENEILSAGGTILEGSLGEKRVVLEWQTKNAVYRAILLEEQYAKALLGETFGEEEWITGVMQVEFSYPEECRAEYETEEYSFYVEQNREE